jgi:hypothetical protein
MLTWEVQFCKSSCITSHGCEVFRGIAKVRHWWHIRVTTYQILVKQLSTWSLVTCKKCESREEQGQLLDRACWCQPKAKYLSTLFFLCSWRGLETSFGISAPTCAAKLQVYLGYNVQYLDFEGDETR